MADIIVIGASGTIGQAVADLLAKNKAAVDGDMSGKVLDVREFTGGHD